MSENHAYRSGEFRQESPMTQSAGQCGGAGVALRQSLRSRGSRRTAGSAATHWACGSRSRRAHRPARTSVAVGSARRSERGGGSTGGLLPARHDRLRCEEAERLHRNGHRAALLEELGHTDNSLMAFVVPGHNAYSHQGVATPEPGGVDAGGIDAFIAYRRINALHAAVICDGCCAPDPSSRVGPAHLCRSSRHRSRRFP
jgi:hypothetical protein